MMSKCRIMMISLLLANLGCASERLHVKVMDNEGRPVTNAVVKVAFPTSHVLFGGGHTSGGGGKAEAKTDTNGYAVVRFSCTAAVFSWHAEAEGYYRSSSRNENFRFKEVITSPVSGYVILDEHEKSGAVTLWKKHNPQPMVAHGVSYEEDQHRFPEEDGRYGFDMMKYDWLPPRGKGEIADFHFVRCFGEDVPDGVVGWLEFPDKCGMYTGKQTGCKIFPSTYEANANAVFRSRIPFVFDHADDGEKAITYKDIVNENEYGVLRTRVVCDKYGNIIKANYAKVLGPFRIGEAYKGFVMYTPCAVFNPRVNDPNLESDPEHSYDPKVKRPLLAP